MPTMTLIFAVSLFELFRFASGSVPCVSGGTNQYQCWDVNGIMNQGKGPLCISNADRCNTDETCECPWCDDQWNCPSFEGCQANGGFVCTNSFLPGTNQTWVCIPGDWKCDGIWDCPSGEDESSEYCNVGKCAGNHNLTYWYQCSDTGRCISIGSVGNGEADCVNGEDENPIVIQEVRSAAITKREGLSTTEPTSEPNTPAPTTSRNFPYGIDLVVQVLGIGLGEVCTGAQARFFFLEVAFASVLSLNEDQVFSTCKRNHHHIRLLHSLLDIESNDEDNGEENVFSSHDHTVIVKLNFDNKQEYSDMLKDILKVERHLREDSSSDEWNEAHNSVAGLAKRVQSELISAMETEAAIKIKITRVSGTF